MKPQRIALFGGTFDPVHLGHVQIARAAVEQLELDRVVFIPCRQSPHKDAATLAGEQDRITMLQLALASHPWAEVSDIETFLPPPSYSWVTAKAMREVFPVARLFWLLGEDQWQTIESWNRVESLAAENNIPANYLVQILIELKAQGIAQSVRGKDGGYRLGRNPSEITMGDVLRAIHGEVYDSPALADKECPPELRNAWKQLQRATESAADSISFQQLVEEGAEKEKMYYI